MAADNPPNAPMPFPISMMAPMENPSTRATSADRIIQMLTRGMASASPHPRPRERRESDTPEPLEDAGGDQEATATTPGATACQGSPMTRARRPRFRQT